MALRLPWWPKNAEHGEGILELCTTGMCMTAMLIGLFGGIGAVVMSLEVFSKSTPMTNEDIFVLISSFTLFSTFFPLSVSLYIGKLLLEKMQNENAE